MPKVTKRKSRKAESTDEETVDQPVITVVDKTPKKAVKRKASSSVDKVKRLVCKISFFDRQLRLQNAKKVSCTAEVSTLEGTTQELEDEEVQLPKTMTLKTSSRLSPKGEKATLKLVSWNINGIRGWLANGGLKYIEQENPDVIGFQVNIQGVFSV